MWHREGEYDPIAEALFGGLSTTGCCSSTTPSAPAASRLALRPKRDRGARLITTKTAAWKPWTSSPRIDEASRTSAQPPSPQCGFASGTAGNLLAGEWRKLDVMLESARRVWGAG